MLIEQHYSNKNYEKSQKLSQELLETLEKQGVNRQLKDLTASGVAVLVTAREIDPARGATEIRLGEEHAPGVRENEDAEREGE